jgi:hypothetical protein
MDFNKLIKNLDSLSSNSPTSVETWDRITISGKDAQKYFNEICKFSEIIESGVAELSIDNDIIPFNDFTQDIKSYNSNLTWKIYVFKDNLLKLFFKEEYKHFFFIKKSIFLEWIENYDVLDTSHPLNSLSPVKIFVNDLEETIWGPKLLLTSPENEIKNIAWPYESKLPSDEIIKREVHFITNRNTNVWITNILVEHFNKESDIIRLIRVKSAIALACCLIQEFYSYDKIVLKATKRIECPLVREPLPQISSEDLTNLINTVSWVYAERTTTRLTLLVDRISLEINPPECFLESLCIHCSNALKQAMEQDQFLVLELKDSYMKELRSLLLDVRKQADEYTDKLRSIQSSLLRDTLAGMFLLSVGVFSKISTGSELFNQTNIIVILSKALGIYFFSSIIIQLLISIPDVIMSYKEIQHWVQFSNNYISSTEKETNIDAPLRKRHIYFNCMATLLVIVYMSLALISWNFYYLLQYFHIIKL